MSNRALQVVQVLGVIPGVALAVCAAIYVFAGSDLLPGDNGGRWFALCGLAFVGGFVAAIVGSVLIERGVRSR